MRVSPPCVHDWLKKKRQPGPDYRETIERWTDGAVPSDAWLEKDQVEVVEYLRSIQPYEDVQQAK